MLLNVRKIEPVRRHSVRMTYIDGFAFHRGSRYFNLALTRSGYELVTDPIPYDAVALGSDEQPANITTDSLVMCENDAGNNDDECPDSRLQRSGSMQMKVGMRSQELNILSIDTYCYLIYIAKTCIHLPR